MKQFPIVLIAIALSAAGISGVLVTGGIGGVSHTQAGAVSTSTTLPGTSVSISTGSTVTVITANLSGLPRGCDVGTRSTTSQGLNLTVYTGSLSPKTGDVMCVVASLRVVGFSASLRPDTIISFTLTDPIGKSVELNSCMPGPRPFLGQAPFQNFACAAYWSTIAPIEGVPPGPGVYHVTVAGSLSYNDKTLPSVSSGFDVVLSNG